MQGFQDGHALIVGIANYAKVRVLPQSVCNDAKDVYDLLQDPNYCGYLCENTKLLLDGAATADQIRAGLSWLQQKTKADSTVIFYFSGHGGRIETGKEAGNYLIPYDCNPNQLAQTAISGSELFLFFEEIQAQRFLMVFDCCYAGGLKEKNLRAEVKFPLDKVGLDTLYYEKLTKGYGRVVIGSSLSDETSLVLPKMRNSLFTTYFLEALRGKSHHRGDGLIRIFDVFDHVSEVVPRNGHQHPVFKTSDLQNNFPVALFLGGVKSSSSVSAQTSLNKTQMRESLSRFFSMGELKNLCQDIQQWFEDEGINVQVNLEILDGDNKVDKVRELIEYMHRRQVLPYLASAARRVRPGIF